MASKVYPKFIELLNAGTLSWTSDTIRCLLVNASGTYDRTHAFISSVVANELSGGSYSRQTLTGKTSGDNGTDKWIFDADDPLFSNVPIGQTVGAAIIYKFVTNDASSPLLAFVDGTDLPGNGSNVTVTLPTTGVHYISY